MKQTNHDQQVLLSSVRNGNVLPDHTDNGQNFTNSKTKFMKKTTVLSVVAMMIFGFLLTGCQHDDSEHKIEQEQTTGQYDKRVYELSNDPEIQAELQFMKDKMGINLSNVAIGKGNGNGVYSIIIPNSWDGYAISRESVQYQMKEKSNSDGIQARHRRGVLMATSGAKNIRYLSSVPAEWKTAINEARLEWNKLGKSLTFNTPTNGSFTSGRLNVSFEPLTNYGYSLTKSKSTHAITYLPDASNPTIGYQLIINTEYAGASTNPSQKKFIMAHELGHSIGFAHTDTYEGVDLTTSNHACSTLLDPSSILRSGSSPVPSWPSSGFSTCDKDAFDWFY